MNTEKFSLGIDKDIPVELLTYNECCIETFTGKYINCGNPRLDDICIEDIAHGLSMECRFGRQLPEFYSVAQHSIECSKIVSHEHKLAALLHDASEAYLGDMASPTKKQLPDYKRMEAKLMTAIAKKFGFEYPLHKEVKAADLELLFLEHRCLSRNATETFPVPVLDMKSSEHFFIQNFYLLK